jgi:hypothetical protein
MSFSLRLGKSSLDRRPAVTPAAEGAPAESSLPAFARGLLLGFAGAFVVLDWMLMGGAVTRGFVHALARLLAWR